MTKKVTATLVAEIFAAPVGTTATLSELGFTFGKHGGPEGTVRMPNEWRAVLSDDGMVFTMGILAHYPELAAQNIAPESVTAIFVHYPKDGMTEEEIEAVVMDHPDTVQTWVVAMPDAKDGDIVHFLGDTKAIRVK